MEQLKCRNGWFSFDAEHIEVLDGIRVIAILIVLWFHFWQQTWLMPYYPAPFLSMFGVNTIDFNSLRRCGYLCVDWMILLSGFVLFLPHARHRILGTPLRPVGEFYKRRLIRILPSYLAAVLIMFFVALADGTYNGRTGFLWRDLLMHLSFTFMVRPDTYLFSGINGVFWTVVIEMLFYAIFPLIGRWFEKRPVWTYLGMTAVGLVFTYAFCLQQADLPFYVNRFLTFLPVFANGMAGAYLYVWFAKKAPFKPLFSVIGTLLAVGSLLGILWMFDTCSHTQSIQWFQLAYRYPLSLLYLGFTLGMCVSAKPVRALLGNRVFAALSAISYNLYLWHQFLIVRLRMALGYRSGADVSAAGPNAQWMLNFEALALALIVAALMTYCLERPLAKWLGGNRIFLHQTTGDRNV